LKNQPPQAKGERQCDSPENAPGRRVIDALEQTVEGGMKMHCLRKARTKERREPMSCKGEEARHGHPQHEHKRESGTALHQSPRPNHEPQPPPVCPAQRCYGFTNSPRLTPPGAPFDDVRKSGARE